MREKEKTNEISNYRLSVTYIEVYKEEMRDLLADDEDTIISIREDESGRTGKEYTGIY